MCVDALLKAVGTSHKRGIYCMRQDFNEMGFFELELVF